MATITSYCVVKNGNVHGLTTKVEKKLFSDWEVQGGICFDGEFYLQAMIKKIRA